jgi:hypothetical protein
MAELSKVPLTGVLHLLSASQSGKESGEEGERSRQRSK